MSDTIRAGRRLVEISHPGKPLFSHPRVSKLQLARHYEAVAEVMLPHVRSRPLALEMFPRGVDERGFFMKSTPEHFPAWIARVKVSKRGGFVEHPVANEAAAMVYLAGQNMVTPHIWLSRADMPKKPDRLIIDFDPNPGIGFAAVRAAAREAAAQLRQAGLAPFAMVTGSRGIHVVAPLRRGPGFGDVHRFTRALAEAMVAQDPKRLTLEWHRAERGSRIYVDVNRINYAQHAVAPYGVRARPGAPVAMPIHLEELSDRKLRPDRWTVASAAARVASDGDAWQGIARSARALPRTAGSSV